MNLLEQVHQNVLLKEAREDFIASKQGDKIIAAYKNDTGKQLARTEVIRIVREISSAGKKQAQWLINMYIAGQFKFEDISKLKLELDQFNNPRIKSKLEKKDIAQYTNLPELYTALDKASTADVKPAKMSSKESRNFYNSHQVVDFYKDNQLHIIIPHSEAASCYFGSGTKWCTASTESENYFEDYNKNGSLYIINTHDKKKFQAHIDSRINELTLMDKFDSPVNIKEFIKKYPSILKAFHKLAISHSVLELIDKSQLSEDELKKIYTLAVRKSPYAIEHIDNQSEELQLLAVNEIPSVIEVINNPTEKVMKIAVEYEGNLIKYIKKPPINIQMSAVRQSGHAIEHIDNQSEELQLLAVKSNVSSYHSIKNPTDKVNKAFNAIEDEWRRSGAL